MALVRQYDHDRYLTSLYAPPAIRPPLWALYAFNAELARIRDVTSEPLIREIRLTWWREAVAGARAGSPRHHPVVAALATVRAVPDALFERMLDARMDDLDDALPPTMDRLAEYGRDTAGALAQAALHVCLAPALPEPALLALAADAGLAAALSGIIRAVRHQATVAHLPADAIIAAGADPEALAGPGAARALDPAALAAILRPLATRASEALARIRAQRHLVPAAARPALLMATLARHDLSQATRAGFELQHPPLASSSVLRQLRLAWAAFTGGL